MSTMDIPIDPALLAEEQGQDADMEDEEGELVDEFLGGGFAGLPDAFYVSGGTSTLDVHLCSVTRSELGLTVRSNSHNMMGIINWVEWTITSV